MKELSLRDRRSSDCIHIQEDLEEGGFNIQTVDHKGNMLSVNLTHHNAKKLQAFINQNSRKGGRKK